MTTTASNPLANDGAIVVGMDAIGAGIAVRFAQAGAHLGLVDDDRERLEAVANQVAHAGQAAITQYSPLGDAASVGAAVHSLGNTLGARILVLNLLPLPEPAPLDAQHDNAFATASTRVRAAAQAMRAIFPFMRAAGSGRIILVGHRYGEGVNDGLAPYNVAAWSLVGLARSAAVDWGQYQIATNVLLPLAGTPEFHAYHARRSKVLDTLIGQLPLRRVGDPVADIGGATLLLAGSFANFVNGEVMHADGGQHVAGPVLNPGRFR
jgi:NAD(P)-dependent dehydrogenase (short-subunit alcohol dehydrogenase family)